MLELKSYLEDRWVTGTGDGQILFDPASGEAVAKTSTEGLDLKAAVGHARSVGNPTLRKMTFAERGELLAGLSKAVHQGREELIELSTLNTGTTRGDGKFDKEAKAEDIEAGGKMIPSFMIPTEAEVHEAEEEAQVQTEEDQLTRAWQVIHSYFSEDNDGLNESGLRGVINAMGFAVNTCVEDIANLTVENTRLTEAVSELTGLLYESEDEDEDEDEKPKKKMPSWMKQGDDDEDDEDDDEMKD